MLPAVRRRRHHSPAAAAAGCRYRGIAAIVAIPVLLIIAVLLLMPRSSPFANDFSRSQPFSRTQYEARGAAAPPEWRYAIVIDAGSTGSRVHIFKFAVDVVGQMQLQFDKFDQLKPGLSSYAAEPTKAAESLAPLLDLAEKTVPAELHASTAIMVGATAGLRMVGTEAAEAILAEVRAYLRKRPFKVRLRHARAWPTNCVGMHGSLPGGHAGWPAASVSGNTRQYKPELFGTGSRQPAQHPPCLHAPALRAGVALRAHVARRLDRGPAG